MQLFRFFPHFSCHTEVGLTPLGSCCVFICTETAVYNFVFNLSPTQSVVYRNQPQVGPTTCEIRNWGISHNLYHITFALFGLSPSLPLFSARFQSLVL